MFDWLKCLKLFYFKKIILFKIQENNFVDRSKKNKFYNSRHTFIVSPPHPYPFTRIILSKLYINILKIFFLTVKHQKVDK